MSSTPVSASGLHRPQYAELAIITKAGDLAKLKSLYAEYGDLELCEDKKIHFTNRALKHGCGRTCLYSIAMTENRFDILGWLMGFTLSLPVCVYFAAVARNAPWDGKKSIHDYSIDAKSNVKWLINNMEYAGHIISKVIQLDIDVKSNMPLIDTIKHELLSVARAYDGLVQHQTSRLLTYLDPKLARYVIFNMTGATLTSAQASEQVFVARMSRLNMLKKLISEDQKEVHAILDVNIEVARTLVTDNYDMRLLLISISTYNVIALHRG